LSENADFAEKCRKKTTFLLGPIETIHIMGSKLPPEAVKAYNIQWFLD
jgi:acetyl/propionyl-CoA carboxylase alpha subunit